MFLNHYRHPQILLSPIFFLIQTSSSEKIVNYKLKQASQQLATGVTEVFVKNGTTLLTLSNISFSILKN